MVVRIRYARPRLLRHFAWRPATLTVAALLTPCALLAFTMAFWIFASEMQWTVPFFINGGLFSRWEIWLAAAAALLLLARVLDKLAQPYPPGDKRATT